MIDGEPEKAVHRAERWALAVAVGMWAIWAVSFVWRTSFVVDGQRVFCLSDDAMISMAYVRNAFEGLGLSWARYGAPVEGFSHPLWLVVMLPANLPSIPLEWRAAVVQFESLAILCVNLIAVRALAREVGCRRVREWLPAVILTACYYPLSFWALMGMETALQALLTVLVVLFNLRVARVARVTRVTRPLGRRREWHYLGALLGLVYLLRMDMALLFVATVAFQLTVAPDRRQRLRALLPVGTWFLAAVVGLVLLRWVYFHDLLPNTYYLKLTGFALGSRVLNGLVTTAEFLCAHAAGLLITLALCLLALRRDRRFGPPLFLAGGIVGLFVAYSAWVGGDAWEPPMSPLWANRFQAFVIPLVCVLFAAGLARLLESLRPTTRLPLGVAMVVVSVAGLNGLLSPGWEARLRELDPSVRPWGAEGHEVVYREFVRFRARVPEPARIATFWAGLPAFFGDYEMVDQLGYNDRGSARLESPVPLDRQVAGRYRPGHMKWNLELTLAEKPDAFFQVWRIGQADVVARMRRERFRETDGFWIRTRER